MTVESLNGSSNFLNGTSLEDIKEMTLNMKVPMSLNTKTKTDAEKNKVRPWNNFMGKDGAPITAVTVEEAGLEEERKFSSPSHCIDEVVDGEDIESNYITNGSYAQGIPTRNRGMLD